MCVMTRAVRAFILDQAIFGSIVRNLVNDFQTIQEAYDYQLEIFFDTHGNYVVLLRHEAFGDDLFDVTEYLKELFGIPPTLHLECM
jgi:hypothetical protein